MQKIVTAASAGASDLVHDVNEDCSGPKVPLLAGVTKRGLDVGLASTALLLLLPLLVTIALLTLVLQGRPILIRHKRVGWNGKLFDCLKFRSMLVDADLRLAAHLAANPQARDEWDATHKLKDDPRVTSLGHVIRKTSIDELPQLLNVLKGEMSLVGPRPIVPAEAHRYGTSLRLYQSVRPGLTGAWQVGGRNDVSYRRRVEMDADYVQNWSIGRDLSILVRTIPAVLTGKGCS